MAQLPASFAGGLELLLQRLHSGKASAQDQAWAAEMLEAVAERVGKKQRTAYVDSQAAREHRIYMDVLAELQAAGDDDVDHACAIVAQRHNTARHYEANRGGNLSAATVRRYYGEQLAIDRAMDALRQLRPWEMADAATDEQLNRLRAERAFAKAEQKEASGHFRQTIAGEAEAGTYAEWLRILVEWNR